MSRRYTAWAILLAGLGAPACDDSVALQRVAPSIAIDPPLRDLGDLPLGIEVEAMVTIELREGILATLDAAEVIPIVGEGFSVELPDDADTRVTEPLTFPIRFRATALGPHAATVRLLSDARTSPDEIIVRAHVVPSIVELQPPVAELGVVPEGQTRDVLVTVRNRGGVEITVESMVLADPRFTVEDLFPVSLLPGLDVKPTISFLSDGTDKVVAPWTVVVAEEDQDPVALLRANDCEGGLAEAYDGDGDGWTACGGDCDDADPEAHPGAAERDNGKDDDCDDVVDEGTPGVDDDGDGACDDPVACDDGSEPGDCNDGDDDVSPLIEEIGGNDIDDDCDGVVDLGSPDGDGDGYGPAGGDCDDSDAAVYPGAPELVDGEDQDCDQVADNGTRVFDDDEDGYAESEGDCNDADDTVLPGADELPNGIDDDCDGTVDEGTTRGDDDGDGFSEVGGDCDDADPNVNPTDGGC